MDYWIGIQETAQIAGGQPQPGKPNHPPGQRRTTGQGLHHRQSSEGSPGGGIGKVGTQMIQVILHDGFPAEVIAYRKHNNKAIVLARRLQLARSQYVVITESQEVEGRMDGIYHDCLNLYHAENYFNCAEIELTNE